MSIISELELSEFRNSTRIFSKTIIESLNEFKSENSYKKVKIFLSHKHNELKELDAAISFLKSFGVEIYVDWLDEEMPKRTSGITAERIKRKILENQKFILLATEGAISSKWCNWELGLGDAAKYLEHIAILPIKSNNSDYSGSEYLEIYPYIYESENNRKKYFIRFPNGKVENIRDWLSL